MDERVRLNLINRILYTLIAFSILGFISIGVYAYNSGYNDPSVMGHSSGEVENFDPLALIPTGAVMYFNLGSCPFGWNEVTLARGRYIVGSYGSSNVGVNPIGNALTDGQDRNNVGPHSHEVTDRGHRHGIVEGNAPGGGNYAYPSNSYYGVNAFTEVSGTGISINPTGPQGTNAPYIRFLVCQKD